MAEDVAAFIRDHGLTKPTLIGHSMYVPINSSSSLDGELIVYPGGLKRQ